MTNTISKELAEHLALDYSSYHKRVCAIKDDKEGLRVWARQLLKTQKRAGIELVPEPELVFHINRK